MIKNTSDIEYQILPLSKETDVSLFDCGNSDLNEFLQVDALKNQHEWFSVTELLYVYSNLIGYYTITPDTLHKGRVAVSDKIGDFPYQKYPAIKLARLAIDKHYQHQGFGEFLMNEFFARAMDAVSIEGGRFLTVDAKSDAVGFYMKYGFHPVKSQAENEIVPLYMDFFRYYNQV